MLANPENCNNNIQTYGIYTVLCERRQGSAVSVMVIIQLFQSYDRGSIPRRRMFRLPFCSSLASPVLSSLHRASYMRKVLSTVFHLPLSSFLGVPQDPTNSQNLKRARKSCFASSPSVSGRRRLRPQPIIFTHKTSLTKLPKRGLFGRLNSRQVFRN